MPIQYPQAPRIPARPPMRPSAHPGVNRGRYEPPRPGVRPPGMPGAPRRKKRRRRLKPKVKRFFILFGIFLFLIIFRPWNWLSGGGRHHAASADTVAAPVPLNHLLNNSHSEFPQAARFDKAVENFLRRWDLTGASLAIMKDGNLIYAKGYGWADKEDDEPMEVRHILRVASISKLITATAVMKLWESGRLRLDQQVFGPQGILSGERFQNYTDKKLEQVTVEHLLRHRAGFSIRAGDPMFNWDMIRRGLEKEPPYTMDDYVEYAVKTGLRYRPGDQTHYSNIGYVVLSKVIEQASGMDYETYVKDSILAPAGCFDMHLGKNRHRDQLQNEVRYYETTEAESVPAADGSGEMVPKSDGGNDVEGLSGAGGWVASPTELLLFVAAIDGDPSRPDILKPSTIRRMTEPKKGELPIGWMQTGGDGTWSRTGTMSGTNALLRKQSNGYTWVFVTNTSSWKGPRFNGYISTMLRQAFDRVAEWPEKDLFEADSLMNESEALALGGE